MVDVSDVPLLGQFAFSGGIVLDVLLNGGEILVAILGALLADPGVLAAIVGYSAKLAPDVAWLPAGALETASTVLAIVLLTSSVIKLLKRAIGAKA